MLRIPGNLPLRMRQIPRGEKALARLIEPNADNASPGLLRDALHDAANPHDLVLEGDLDFDLCAEGQRGAVNGESQSADRQVLRQSGPFESADAHRDQPPFLPPLVPAQIRGITESCGSEG